MLSSISVWNSVSVCCLLSFFFVLSLYFVDPGLPRNHPVTVHRRIWAISVVCLIAPTALYLFVRLQFEAVSIVSFTNLLGIKWNGLFAAICYPTFLILTLYAGPIFHNWVDESSLIGHGLESQRNDIIIRNYVIAPLAEELIFRACMLLFLCPAIGEQYAVLLCPVFFGIAHIHHLIDWYRINDNTSFQQACFSVILQICYTSVFGLFAGFLFVRTRHLVGLVLCHSLCNLMGLPPIYSALMHPKKYLILAVYVTGTILFFSLLFPLTTPSLYSNFL